VNIHLINDNKGPLTWNVIDAGCSTAVRAAPENNIAFTLPYLPKRAPKTNNEIKAQ
jgi:hypothetical protein